MTTSFSGRLQKASGGQKSLVLRDVSAWNRESYFHELKKLNYLDQYLVVLSGGLLYQYHRISKNCSL